MIEDLFRAIFRLSPSEKRINTDIATMRRITRPVADEIIPWEREREIDLLSLNATTKSEKDGMDKIWWGALQSIYFEPMAVWAYKTYVKGSREALLYCRTKETELIYRLQPKKTDVYFNGKFTAWIDPQGAMYGVRSRQLLGRFRPYSADWISVVIGDRESGHVFDAGRPHPPQQRAFMLLRQMEQEAELIFLAFGFYLVLTRRLANKKPK